MAGYQNLKATIRIGKQGITDSIVKEIKLQLKQKKVVKIKMLGAFRDGEDKEEAANNLAKLTNSTLVQRIGGVLVLKKGS